MILDMLAQMDLMHAIAGLMVGILVGLTGVGGGALMTPILVLIFGVNPQTAVGTDLLYAGTTKTVGSAVHGWRETVNWAIVKRLAAGSIPASCLTLFALSKLGEISKHTQNGIMIVLAVMLLLTALAVTFQKRLIAFAVARKPMNPRKSILPTIILGAVIGSLVSITSVGAGAIGVTALLMLYPNLPVARIVGTDIAHAVPLAFIAGFGHMMIGDVDVVMLFNLLAGSIPGVVIGSLLSSKAPDRWLRPALAVVLALSAISIFGKAWSALGAAEAEPAAAQPVPAQTVPGRPAAS